MALETVYTPKELAEHWKVETEIVQALIESGELKGTKFGGFVRITTSALQAYLNSVNGPAVGTKSPQLDISINLAKAPDFSHRWPDSKHEAFSGAYEGTASFEGRSYHIKLGFTTRHSAGKTRRRSLVLVDRYATVEFVSAGTSENGPMASVIKDRFGKQVPVGVVPPAEYSSLRVGPYQDVVIGPGASNGLAVICDSEDIRTMVIHALIRIRYREERK